MKMKYLVNLDDGTEILYDDDSEPIARKSSEHLEMLLFRGIGDEEIVVAFCPIPYVTELGHEADAICSGDLLDEMDDLAEFVKTLKGVRRQLGTALLEELETI